MKKNRIFQKSGRIFIFCLLFSVLFSGICSFQADAKEQLTFTKQKSVMTAGTSYTFKTNHSNAAWSVSNLKIASVSKTGRVKAKRAGTVKITASYGGEKRTCKLTVKGKKIIGIDPGHQQYGNSSAEPVGPGSKTKKAKVAGGTRGTATKVPEYKLTLSAAKKLKTELWNRGYEVVMTRTKHEVDISNKERAVLINKSGADICIRLHADGAASSQAKGASALYPSAENPYVASLSKKSSKLAQAVLTAYCKSTNIKSRGCVKRDDLTGTNWSKVPVIVLEMGFMTNPSEDKYMQTKTGQKKMVSGIANGIDAYYE